MMLTITCHCIAFVFGEPGGEKIVQKGAYTKMACGEMVRFLAGIHAEAPEDLKTFNLYGSVARGTQTDESEGTGTCSLTRSKG